MLKRIAYVAYWILLTATCLGTVTMGACQLGPGGGPLGPSGGGGTSLPAGFTFLSTTSCPTGYTAVVGSSGKFVLLGATGGAMGGADQITPTGSVTAPTFTGSSGTVDG